MNLDPDFERAAVRSDRASVFTLTITTTSKAWHRTAEGTAFTKQMRAALGLDRQLVGERVGEIGLWEKLLPETRSRR